jgi:UDP-glucuronate 4-epimerase
MKIVITGSAGFIGFHLALRLLREGHEVLGFDALTDYYDVRLKRARHAVLGEFRAFRAVAGHLENADLVQATIAAAKPEIVVHLAAQAGVRYSLEHPETYVASNSVGTFNLLEALRRTPVRHAILASTSSVYGGTPNRVFVETDRTDFPLSIYAATKRGTEAMAHSYAHLFAIPVTMARFFTVYGPWGRPDMALFRFAGAIEAGTPIEVYGEGRQSRDFTYIDDVVEAVVRLLDTPPVAGQSVAATDPVSPVAPWRAVNVAAGRPVELMASIAALERAMGKEAVKRLVPMQAGDMSNTRADTTLLRALTGFVPSVGIDEGTRAFVDWFRTDWARLRAQT